MNRLWVVTLILAIVSSCWAPAKVVTTEEKAALGSRIFFDKMLSEPDGQACSVCHAPRSAFADPFNAAVSEGMVDGAFVNRNAQSLTYVSFVPPLHRSVATGEYAGGLFWDGRSDDLRHQLAGPFFNPAEMNNADTAELVYELKFAAWRKQFIHCYGKPKSDSAIYAAMTDAIAHYEKSSELQPFTSAYDAYLRQQYQMTPAEQMGYQLFKGQARCIDCHSIDPVDQSGHVLFTDYGYRNLGLPKNNSNPFYTTSPAINPNGYSAIDNGLGAVVKDENQNGKFRTPSLRNVALTAPYFHHGGVASLEEAVRYMAYRKQIGAQPEVLENIEKEHSEGVPLTEAQIKAIVAFLQLLSDGFVQTP